MMSCAMVIIFILPISIYNDLQKIMWEKYSLY